MSLDKWREFLAEAPRRGSPAGIRRSLNRLLRTGPQTGGSPYDEPEEFLKGKKNRNQISAPPGAAGGLEEEVEEETFEMQDELQPEIWRRGNMWPEVRTRLLEVVENFIEGLEVEIPIVDIRLTGSLANYNWSKYSDADVHIVVDFKEVDEDIELVKAFFDAARLRWNDIHTITLYDFEVELYFENVGDPHHSSGVYSILDDTWVIKPTPHDVEIDFVTARKKSDDIETKVNLIDYIITQGNSQGALRSIEKVKVKIRRMRSAGLESERREFSPENIAFKILRRNNTLERLNQLKHNAYDRSMSLDKAHAI